MLKLELIGIKEEFKDHRTNTEGPEWIAWRYLEIVDSASEQHVADWFYVGVCTPQYLQNHTSELTPIENKSLLAQKTFSERGLYDFAKAKFDSLKFDDWDDFTKKCQ